MAQVIQDPQLQARIDGYLEYLLQKWKSLPELAAEWDDWDDLSQLTFVVDWGVPADRLHQLRAWAAEGILTPSQQARYDELLRLVEWNQPILDRLLAD